VRIKSNSYSRFYSSAVLQRSSNEVPRKSIGHKHCDVSAIPGLFNVKDAIYPNADAHWDNFPLDRFCLIRVVSA